MNKIVCPNCKDPHAVLVLVGVNSAICQNCATKFNAYKEGRKQLLDRQNMEKQISDILVQTANKTAREIAEIALGFKMVAEEKYIKAPEPVSFHVNSPSIAAILSERFSRKAIENLIPGQVLRDENNRVWAVVSHDKSVIYTQGTIMSLEGMITLE